MNQPSESEEAQQWEDFLARLTARLKQFVGGQFEVVNIAEKTVCRGQIRKARLVGKKDTTRKLVLTLDWYASQLDDHTWAVESRKEFPSGRLIYYDLMDLGNGRRLYFASNATMGELIVLYPIGDEPLDPDQVIGLDVVS